MRIPGLWRLQRLKNLAEQQLRGRFWIAKRFGDPAAHEGMLLDTVRCNAYREAVRRVVRPGDIVVDIGAGTGLLSLFAVEAGAKHVYALEMSAIADIAGQIIASNNMQDRITLIRRKSTRTTLPCLGDVLVTETLSILGFDTENTCEFIADAKRRLLKPEARIIPQTSDTYLMPVQSDAFGIGQLPSRMYDFDFSPLRRARYSRQAIHTEVSGKSVLELAEPVRHWHIDFSAAPRKFEAAEFVFKIRQEGRLDGFIGWFEAGLCPGVTLTNSPRDPRTSWGQVYFPIREQPMVRVGQSLKLIIDPHLVAGWPRWDYRIQLD